MVMTHSTRRSARPKASLERPESPFKIRRKTRRTVSDWVILGIVVGIAVIVAAPFYLIIINSVLNAYVIGIGKVKGRTWIVVVFLIANILPQEVLLYPLYFIFKAVSL